MAGMFASNRRGDCSDTHALQLATHAIAAAAAVPGTVVHRVAPAEVNGRVRFGHPSGCLGVGIEAVNQDGQWIVKKVLMSRSARRLMEGWVRVPGV
jgi:2-methylaconitate cis-trans-isomerase PrpF